jgi:RimJ/RimL family protein N-acetyltransferase
MKILSKRFIEINYRKILSFQRVRDKFITFTNERGSFHLIQVGKWIFDYKSLISNLCDERFQNNEFFLQSIKPDDKETIHYLKRSILDSKRMLFFIFFEDFNSLTFVGTIGIKDISDKSATLDLVIKFKVGSHLFSMQQAVFEIENFIYCKLKVNRIKVEVLNTNFKAIEFYKRIGFEYIKEDERVTIKSRTLILMNKMGQIRN